ncbi:PAS domain S-box protein [Sulfuriflexus mobilis]|uniref:PAS domain S-box protein n=1 Tax=Sulfuriflexus mobilis TaxID=1811807 RepID=UPI000F81A4AB|nr:PAS domain S-box protein [Sulfuriflexus mobilis]
MNSTKSSAGSSIDEKELIEIFNYMVEGIITINDRGKILIFNHSAETMFGYDSSEVIGSNINILMPEPQRSNHDNYLKNYIETGIAHIIGIGRKVTAVKKNGEKFPIHLSVTEYPSKKEGERWFIGSLLDISQQVKQEEQLRRSMKMDALGKLTGGISHDYNNMLGIIIGYSEILSRILKDEPKPLEYVETIRHAAQRGSDLTRKLLSFSSDKPFSSEVVIINDLLNDDYKMLKKTLTANIQLTLKLEKDLWPVLVDKGCLEDAILNMSINAMHAMPEGGKLDFATSNAEIGPIDAQVLNIDSGEYVKLAICDTGIGMNEEILSHVFDPFYTTKNEKGTGLGLSQVYGFVNNAGGTIRVYSEPGKGSCFSIYFPKYVERTDNIKPISNNARDETLPHPPATILVVDDEPDLNNLTCTILRADGYSVFSAANAKQALTILENRHIDLVISDVIMPQTDGFELAHYIKNTYPNIKIQLCSGFAENRGKTVTDEDLYKKILLKPFMTKELLARVKEVLEE